MSPFTGEAVPGRPYWWEDVTWPKLDGALPGAVDLLVIGAGYTGLSAAIAAHDAGARVAVIDAGQPGQGASTRNGGMVGAHPRLGWTTLAASYGSATADALFAEAGAALGWLRELIAREGIDCAFAETGRIQLAYTDAQFAAQRTLARQISEKGGVPCRIIPREGLSAEISTPLYRGGLLFPNHGGLHPAKYLLGLLAAVLRRGVPVIADCPATEVTRHGPRHRIATTLGAVVADKVVLATNGYTKAPFDWFARRVFALPSYLIATEPLPAAQIAGLAPGGRMMVETRARHSYFRVSPDGTRLIFGGRAALVDIDLARAARRLRATLVGIWPDLSEVKLSHVWSGNTGYSFAHMPHVGAHSGVHFALGYSGGGTVLAPYLGRKAALQALGLPDGATAFSDTAFGSRWFHRGGAPHFLRAADLWYRTWVDLREDIGARR